MPANARAAFICAAVSTALSSERERLSRVIAGYGPHIIIDFQLMRSRSRFDG
jgi:hypothetical protein